MMAPPPTLRDHLRASPDLKMEQLLGFEVRHRSGAHASGFLKSFLRVFRHFGYATRDDSWGELEKELAIVVRRLVVAERERTAACQALRACWEAFDFQEVLHAVSETAPPGSPERLRRDAAAASREVVHRAIEDDVLDRVYPPPGAPQGGPTLCGNCMTGDCGDCWGAVNPWLPEINLGPCRCHQCGGRGKP